MTHGSKSVSVAVMALLFGLSVSIVFLGCSGGGGNPITPDEGMANSPESLINRQAQDFDDIYEWGSATILDNASSTWVPPTPQYPTEPEPGLLAVVDADVSPLVTATVKDDPGGEGSVITVRLDDLDGMGSTPDYETSFSAPYGITHTDTYCRHPSVEVAYCRSAQDLSGTGHIYVYIAWSQLVLSGQYLHWDLFGARVDVPVHATGIGAEIEWGNEDPSEPLPLTATRYPPFGEPWDELQPDLALMVNGDLLLTYITTNSATFDYSYIMAMRLDYDPQNPGALPVQVGAYKITGIAPGAYPTPRHIAPSIDVGYVYSINDDSRYTAVCAWFFELVNGPGKPTPYQILYATWDALDDDYSGTPIALPSDEGQANALVKVDIPPFDADLEDLEYNEAIFTWTNFDYSISDDPPWVQHYVDPVIQIQVAPYASGTMYEIPSTYGIASEVACYERAEDEEQWFGLSFYEADTGGDVGAWDWDGTRINSYSFDDGYDLTYQETRLIDISPAFWWLGAPFASSTICLRDPSLPDYGSPPEPIHDIFMVSKVQGEYMDTTVWIAEGEIY